MHCNGFPLHKLFVLDFTRYLLYYELLSFLWLNTAVSCLLELFAQSPMCRQSVPFLTHRCKVHIWTGSRSKLSALTDCLSLCAISVCCQGWLLLRGLWPQGPAFVSSHPLLQQPRARPFTGRRPALPQESGARGRSEQVSCCQPRVKFLSDGPQRFWAQGRERMGESGRSPSTKHLSWV